MNQRNWLKSNSFHHSEFEYYPKLIELKRKRNWRISLCIPCLNEERTIGIILDILVPKLMLEYPLLDEIMVIDSGSTDGTEFEVMRRNIPFYKSEEILPHFGNFAGKGENLWKSIFIAEGDIIVWLDADIKNIHPRFVYGLVGPLLYSSKLQYVKACYRRPIQIGSKFENTGGGRVTEILVKPFFNLLFPELAVFNQPLSGEYAGRRQLLERLPFFTGYGVETGLLIDIERFFGHECMAQVNLSIRVHRNQSIEKLRKMSFALLQVLFKRAEEQGKLVLFQHLEDQFISNLLPDEAEEFIDTVKINEIERPPMMQVQAYQKKQNLQRDDIILHQTYRSETNETNVSLSALVEQQLIFLKAPGVDKPSIFRHVCQHFVEQNIVHSENKLYNDLLKREELISTGIGKGIAIPHCISRNVTRFSIAIYNPKTPVNFDSIDAKPVQLFFFVVAPLAMRQLYLKLLGNLSKIMRDNETLPRLLQANTELEFLTILKKIEFMKQVVAELRAE